MGLCGLYIEFFVGMKLENEKYCKINQNYVKQQLTIKKHNDMIINAAERKTPGGTEK